ncbi:glycosyltransferase family 9 protein [Cupriavidus alkaliphilus]|uniref:glycosyltransferase family 9 protein n=1 Tax=Cupriavidus alkaliphilus TaxID=942866 RepID=UPI00339D2F47
MSKQWKVWLANLCIGLYRALCPKPRASGPSQSFSRIVVFSTTALGDFMFNTPAIRALREKFPNARITLVANPRNRDLVSGCHFVDDVIYWDHKAKSLVATIRSLRRRRPELAMILHSKAPYDVVAATLAGCTYVFKNIYDDEQPGLERWLAGATRTCDAGHLIQSKLNLVGQLGCNTTNAEMFVPVRPASASSPRKTIIGFQLGASQPVRCWPVGHFVQLARSLLAESDETRIALIGSDKESLLANHLLAALTEPERQRVVNYVGRTSLPELLGAIQGMAVLVSGDTGPLHLAIALKVRTVSLFATACPTKTGPYQDQALHKVIRLPADAAAVTTALQPSPMSLIAVEDVRQAVVHAIRGAGLQDRPRLPDAGRTARVRAGLSPA